MLPTPDFPPFPVPLDEGNKKRSLEHPQEGLAMKKERTSLFSSSPDVVAAAPPVPPPVPVKSTRLHVDNLPLELTDEQLLDLFRICGPVFAGAVNRPEGFAPRSKTASVVFEHPESAELALVHLQGFPVMGSAITIDRVNNLRSDPVSQARASALSDFEEWEFAFLTEKLSLLTTSSRLIGEVMVFAVETSPKADAIVEMILVSLSLHGEEAQANHTLALVYVLNDILCNAQTSYLTPITHRLVEICLAIKSRANSPAIGRLSRINFVTAVLNTLALWERRFISGPVASALKHILNLQK